MWFGWTGVPLDLWVFEVYFLDSQLHSSFPGERDWACL
jgi:hypothetical protein